MLLLEPELARSYPMLPLRTASRLRDSSGSLPMPIPLRLPELELQSLWYAGAFGAEFNSTCGQSVRITQFGEWNRLAGPDFRHAGVEIGGSPFRGAIEIDPEAEDWERHHHAVNPAFNEVILHVFVANRTSRRFFTRTADHRNVVQVRLEPQAVEDAWRSSPPPAARTGRCSRSLRNLDHASLDALLQGASRHRLDQKARRLARIAHLHGWSEAVYQGVAEALGYHPNQLPMRVISQRHPLRSLLSLPPVRREATMFGSAGFLRGPGLDQARAATRDYLLGLWQEWWKLRESDSPMPGIRWTLSGVRPLNHPHRRLGALAALLDRWAAFESLIPGLSTVPPPSDWPKRVASFLSSLEHPHWSRHHTLCSAPSPRPLALFGGERILDILGNVLFPVAVRHEPLQWDAYLHLPAGKSNEKLERALVRLFGESLHRPKVAPLYHRQQALLQIYEDFCLEDTSDCVHCPFPEQLETWAHASPAKAARPAEAEAETEASTSEDFGMLPGRAERGKVNPTD